MKFSILTGLILLDKSSSSTAAEIGLGPNSWEGNLPNNVYGPGDRCEESNLVGNGTTTKLVAADDGSLCETDIIGGVTLYSKFTVTCGSEEYPDDVFMKMYNCADDMCTNCDATTEFEGYALKEEWDPKSIKSNVGHCFGWATTVATNQTEMAIIVRSEHGYQKYIPPSTLEDYSEFINLFLRNTCFGNFIGYDAEDENVEENNESASMGDSTSSASLKAKFAAAAAVVGSVLVGVSLL